MQIVLYTVKHVQLTSTKKIVPEQFRSKHDISIMTPRVRPNFSNTQSSGL